MTTVEAQTSKVELPEVPTQLYINGEWCDAASGETFEVIAPSSEETIAHIARGVAEDVDRAVRAARAQIDGGEWSRMTGTDRRRLLSRLGDLIERDFDKLALLDAVDGGKTLMGAKFVDIPSAVDTYHYFAGWADKIDGRMVEALPHMGQTRHSYTIREPIGVVGAIVPWNAPTMITAWKLGPALAAGCTVVVKSPEDAPLTTQHLSTLIAEAGFPAGVVNIVPGFGEEAGAPLARHPGVDKVSFTGSPEVGRDVAIACAADFRRVTLELGGKSPQIVLADADLEAAIGGLALGIFANQGEVCAAGTRMFVHRKHYEDVLSGLAEAVRGVKLGDPLDETATMGALINSTQLERVTGYIEAGKAEGARLVAGGGRPDRKGYFVEPAIFADGNNDMKIAREEIFGPVGLVMPFDDPAEAARLANETRYGLSAYIWTRDVSAAHLLARQVRAGTVWINGFGAPDARLPWGGLKTSGVGRELSWAGIESHTEEKTVTIVL